MMYNCRHFKNAEAKNRCEFAEICDKKCLFTVDKYISSKTIKEDYLSKEDCEKICKEHEYEINSYQESIRLYEEKTRELYDLIALFINKRKIRNYKEYLDKFDLDIYDIRGIESRVMI